MEEKGGETDRGEQEHQVEDKHISLSVLKGSFLQEKIHQLFLIHTSVAEQKRKTGRKKGKCWWESEQTQPTLSEPFHPSCWTNKMSSGVP